MLSTHMHAAAMVTNVNRNLRPLRREGLDSVRYHLYKLDSI